MKGLFIDDNEEIVVKFVLAQDKSTNEFYVDVKKEGLEKTYADKIDVNLVEEHEVVFKRPGFKDKTDILSKSTSILGSNADGMKISIDVAIARFKAMVSLIKRWTFKDNDGNDVPVSEENVSKLDPFIAAIISAQFDTQVGGMF